MIKKILKEYRRRRILRDIKKAKRYFQEGVNDFMCHCFMLVDTKYRNQRIDRIIPEFNQDFLNAKKKSSDPRWTLWWSRDDRESRIKAFDKLIEVYSKK